MYFYANEGVDKLMLERSMDDVRFNFVGLDNGHVSSKTEVEAVDFDMATKAIWEFRAFDNEMSKQKLAKYLAAFRDSMEAHLVRSHGHVMDQRCVDYCIKHAVKASLTSFIVRQPMEKRRKARWMVNRICQIYSATLAARLDVGILWHFRGAFMIPDGEDDDLCPRGPFLI